jgi:cytochrome c oxidase assembly factor CtaG
MPLLDLHHLLSARQVTVLPDLVVVVSLGAYAWGMYRVGKAHPTRPWPIRRAIAFASGMSVIVVALGSGIGIYDDQLFALHMVQHLLLLAVAPPLLISGRPGLLLLHASRNPLHTWAKRALRHPITTAATFPLVGLAGYVAVVVGTHLTHFMDLSLTHPLVHQSEHLLYLMCGYIFFLPVIGGEPLRWRLTFPTQFLLLAFGMAVDSFTGIVLMQTNYEMFPEYAAVRRSWGPTVLDDLHLGGAIMWVGGDAIMGVALIFLAVQVISGQRRVDNPRWVEQARATAVLGDTHQQISGLLDIDEDDAAFAAYNRHLAALDRRERRHTAGPET